MQLVSAPDCGSGYRRFESGYPPFSLNIPTGRAVSDMKSSMGYRQAVRHRTLTPAFAGSNPASPGLKKESEIAFIMGYRQAVRQRILIPSFAGSNPATLVKRV